MDPGDPKPGIQRPYDLIQAALLHEAQFFWPTAKRLKRIRFTAQPGERSQVEPSKQRVVRCTR